MPDNKPVTFDAAVALLQETCAKAPDHDWARRRDAFLVNLHAAPAPAAQSAGQEAVAERCARFAELYRDEHATGKCCEETCDEIAQACRDYAVPVNDGERITVETLDPAQYAKAAAVMGTCPDGPTDDVLKRAIVTYLGGEPWPGMSTFTEQAALTSPAKEQK